MEERKYKKDECITFNSYNENCIFSNMYPCVIKYNDKNFQGVDVLFHWLLAQHLNDVELMDKIEKCKGVNACYKAKKLFDEKHKDVEIDFKIKKTFLLDCLRHKEKCCMDFSLQLFESGDKPLVEYAFWGDTLFGAVERGNEYVGVNACGRLMMQVRKEIQAKYLDVDFPF